MIFNGTYKTRIELKNVIVKEESLKQLITKLLEQGMDYKLEVDFYDGDSLRNIKLDKLLDFQYKTKEIKELQLYAEKKGVSVWLSANTNNSWSHLDLESMDDLPFYQIKTILQDWVKTIKNENKLSYLRSDNFKGTLARYFCGLLLTLCISSLLVFSFKPWNDLYAWITVVMTGLIFSILVSIIIDVVLGVYFVELEIDICDNKFKKRRKTAYWLLTIIIIPIATNLICNLI